MLIDMGSAHLDQGRITDERALRWAHLFNLRYHLLLDCLQHSLLLPSAPYATNGDRTPKGLLQYWTFAEMRRLKKIAEKLVELPVAGSASLRAGAPFELPFSLSLPHIDSDRWAALAGRFEAARAYIESSLLVVGEPAHELLASVAGSDARAATIAGAIARGVALPADAHPTEFRKAMLVLDEAVRGFDVAPRGHGTFWRGVTRDQLVAATVSGGPVITPGDTDNSPLLDLTGAPENARGMPRFRPRIAAERQSFLVDWVARGAPDNVPGGTVGTTGEPSPPREAGSAPPPPPPGAGGVSFEQEIKPLFTARDRSCMIGFGFDLHLYDDVKAQADRILEEVESGRMPLGGTPWTREKVDLFRKWMTDAFPA